MADGVQTAPRNVHHPQRGLARGVPPPQHLDLHRGRQPACGASAASISPGWSNAMIELQVPLCEASIQMASKGLSFRLKAPTFVQLKGERPHRPREYWPEKNFKWPDANKEDPRPAWRLLPRPDHHLKDNLQYPCTANAVASIAQCHAFLSLLRVAWTKEGCGWTPLWGKMIGMTTRTTPISTTSILIDRMIQVCCRCSLLCMDLRMIRSPHTLLVPRRGFPIKTITN